MLLFLIGLEVRPQRLWIMRRAVFGLGTAQVAITGAALAALAHIVGVAWQGAIVLGAGLAMSSTAIVLPMLAERDLLDTRAGRDAFAVLLFQDLAFIPLVALVPLLAGDSVPDHVPWHDVARAALIIAIILVGGRFLLRPLFRAVGGAKTPEVFTTVALLIVAGTACSRPSRGCRRRSAPSWRACCCRNSEYRHELQADIEPFEGLLLGFFFISVGMSADLPLARAAAALLAEATAALLLVKAAIAFVLARIAGATQAERAALRPRLAAGQRIQLRAVRRRGRRRRAERERCGVRHAGHRRLDGRHADPVRWRRGGCAAEARAAAGSTTRSTPDPTPVIICGFGRFGQIIGRVLRMHGIEFTALERDPGQVEVVRRFGTKVYFGDPTRPDVLRAAGAEQAKLLIVRWTIRLACCAPSRW